MRLVQELSVMERSIFLMDVPQFASLATDEIALIAGRSQEVRFEAGERMPEEGEDARAFYMIVEGAIEQRNGDLVVRTAKRGMPFGLFGLMGVDTADEHAVAIEPSHAIQIRQADFYEILADHPTFTLGLIKGIAQTVRDFALRIEELERKLAEKDAS